MCVCLYEKKSEREREGVFVLNRHSMCACFLSNNYHSVGFGLFCFKSLVTNLVRGDIKLFKPLLIVRGDDVGVRIGRLGVAKLVGVD